MTTDKKKQKEKIKAYITGDERLKLYAKILNKSLERLKKYYNKNPTYVGDDRSLKGIEESVSGLNDIFDELDSYDLVPREVKFERMGRIEPENSATENE